MKVVLLGGGDGARGSGGGDGVEALLRRSTSGYNTERSRCSLYRRRTRLSSTMTVLRRGSL